MSLRQARPPLLGCRTSLPPLLHGMAAHVRTELFFPASAPAVTLYQVSIAQACGPFAHRIGVLAG